MLLAAVAEFHASGSKALETRNDGVFVKGKRASTWARRFGPATRRCLEESAAQALLTPGKATGIFGPLPDPACSGARCP